MTPISSMTGFATVRGSTAAGLDFVLSAKSVNHRFLDLSFRLPGGLDALEMKLRQICKEHLRRGHVDITLQFERSGEGELRLKDAVLLAGLNAFREAASRHGLRSEPDLNILLQLPGVMAVEHDGATRDMPALEGAVAACMPELIDNLRRARSEEGEALAVELRAAMARIAAISVEIGRLRGDVREALFERLRSRLTRVLEGIAVDGDRLLTEAALLVERSDIEEENVRLMTHVERFVAMLDEGGELGKRLDFLLQELNREANTMLSKTGGAAGEPGHRITELGLALKLELERAREQVQNLE